MTENTKTLESLLVKCDLLSDFDRGRLVGQCEALASLDEKAKDKKDK